MAAYLHALALKNYRGIGPEYQVLKGFKKFNIFIGANNSGKSTVLNFISRHLPILLRPSYGENLQAPVLPLEVHSGVGGASVSMQLGVPTDTVISAIQQRHPDVATGPRLPGALKMVMNAIAKDGYVWIGSTLPYADKIELVTPSIEQLIASGDSDDWYRLWTNFSRRTGGGIQQHWVPETISTVTGLTPRSLPDTFLIPAIREIGPKGSEFGDFSGRGLIDRLAEMQSPDHDMRHERTLFDRINGFLAEVTDSPNAVIEIPHNREHILVHMNGRVLPLSSLGTGIQEVVMIAAFCTIKEKSIICVEEPELHLHPLLQRKLIRFLDENTTNQYFIATHSPSFIDSADAAVFHVRLAQNTTQITSAHMKRDLRKICEELGYRASDIIQSNAVIWVEGPSDRIYINSWINNLYPNFIEGIHYTIMFYGGRLLNHLSANDEEILDFIELRSLNRNVAIVIDSDRRSPHSPINATKQRIVGEIEKFGGFVWVTKGREIENYLEAGELDQALSSIYSKKYISTVGVGPYDHVLHFQMQGAGGARRGRPPAQNDVGVADKIKVAKFLAANGMALDVLDLRKRITDLGRFIEAANR